MKKPRGAPKGKSAPADVPAKDESDSEQAPHVDNGFGKPGRPFAKTSFHHGLYAGLGLIVAYVLFQSIQIVLPLLIVIVVSAFLAIGLNPIVTRIQRWGLPRSLGVVIVCLGVILILCGGLFSIVPPIYNEGSAFIERIPAYINELLHQHWLTSLSNKLNITSKLHEAVNKIDADTAFAALGGVASVVGVAVNSIFNAIMIALLTVYFLLSFDRLKAGFYRLLPAHRRERAQALGDEILAKVGGYTVGALGIGVVAGCSSFVFMLAAGVPYAYALAFLVAILDLIPQIGATLGAVIVTLVGLTVSVWVAIACAVFFIIYQQLENWLIYPTVMRRSVKVSDLAAILGLLIGATLFGVVGALLAVPTVAAIQLIVREVYIPRQNIS